jgi:hypothetical protein
MEAGLNSLSEMANFHPGDRVKTLRGSVCGTVTRLLPDGRVAWRPDDVEAELLVLPESLLRL